MTLDRLELHHGWLVWLRRCALLSSNNIMTLCGRREPESLALTQHACAGHWAGQGTSWIATSECSPVNLGELDAAGRRFCYVLAVQIADHLFHRLVHGEQARRV